MSRQKSINKTHHNAEKISIPQKSARKIFLAFLLINKITKSINKLFYHSWEQKFPLDVTQILM